MRVSQSQIATWQRCPLLYRFRKIDGLVGEKSAAAPFGNVIHDAIVVLETTNDISVALQRFREQWASAEFDYFLPRTSFNGYLEKGEDILRKWWDIQQWNASKVLAREYYFEVPLGRHTLNGYIDRLELRYLGSKGGNCVCVLDYKSNAKLPTREYLRHDVQFTAYCRAPETPVLMADMTWKPIGDLAVGDEIMAVDEEPVERSSGVLRRHWRRTSVRNVWGLRKEAFRITCSDGTEMVVGAGHRLLAQGGGNWCWRTVEDLAANLDNPRRKTVGIKVGRVVRQPLVIDYDSVDYQAGYIAGATLGDGCIRSDREKLSYWQIALGATDSILLDRLNTYLHAFGISVDDFQREPSERGWQRSLITGLRTHKRAQVEQVAAMCDNPSDSDDYAAGWLAGLYDTDGGRHAANGTISFFQKEHEVLELVCKRAAQLGFQFRLCPKSVELIGDRTARVEFTSVIQPALVRKVEQLDGTTVRIFGDVRLVAVEPLGERQLIDITTGTGTYVAQGFINHNCYATTRPEFWAGFGDKADEMFNAYKDWPRIGEWVALTQGPKRVPAGDRTERDYTRLEMVVDGIEQSIGMGIFIPNLIGSACEFCEFRKECGLPSREEEGNP